MKGIKGKYLKLSFLIHVMSILTFIFSYGAYTLFQYIKFTKRPNKVKEQAFIPNTISLAQLSAVEQEILKNQIQKTLKKQENSKTPATETTSKTIQKSGLQIQPQIQPQIQAKPQETTPLKTEEPTKQEPEIKNKEEKPKNKEEKPTKKTKPKKTEKQNNSTQIKSLKENIQNNSENTNSKETTNEVVESTSQINNEPTEVFLKEETTLSRTVSDEDIIRYQIIKAWSQFDGFDEIASSLIVPVNIKLDINGRLISVIERDSGHFSFLSKKQKKVYKDMFSKAKIAIQEATPIEGLDKNNFQKWKSIDLDFKVETGFY
jgi:hypothetical protein